MKTEWKIHQATNQERQKDEEAYHKACEALAQDEKERKELGSGLPKDWRSRIIR